MALLETLTDNFNDNSISANWDKNVNSGDGTQVVETNGRIEISHNNTNQYNALATTSSYDLTGSYAFVELLDVGDQRITSHDTELNVYVDSNNGVWFSIQQNVVAAYKRVAGVQTRLGTMYPYNSGTWRWLRIREAGGITYMVSSADGRNWVIRWSFTNLWAVTAVKAAIYSGAWQAETSGSYSIFDNFNIITPEVLKPNIPTRQGFS